MNSASREPLLWLQLLSLGVIPLEIIFLRLLLGGSELGPIPFFERTFLWTLAVIAPTISLWERPADWASLCVLKQPLKTRSIKQLKLSSLQIHPFTQTSLLLGAITLFLLLWWVDQSAVLINEFSPLKGSSRAITLLSSAPLLTLLLWQWHQLSQSIWLLTRSDNDLERAIPLPLTRLTEERTSLGLGVLKFPELELSEQLNPLSIKPQQPSKQKQSTDLDTSIPTCDTLPSKDSDSHNKETKTS